MIKKLENIEIDDRPDIMRGKDGGLSHGGEPRPLYLLLNNLLYTTRYKE
jgi:hypothetical protein